MLEHVGADIGDHPLAEPVHAIKAGGAGKGEDEADTEERGEIFVDQVGLDPGEADIDHAPHRQRNGERGGGRDDERHEGRSDHALVTQNIGLERQQRAERGAALSFRFRRSRGGKRSVPVLTVWFDCHELG